MACLIDSSEATGLLESGESIVIVLDSTSTSTLAVGSTVAIASVSFCASWELLRVGTFNFKDHRMSKGWKQSCEILSYPLDNQYQFWAWVPGRWGKVPEIAKVKLMPCVTGWI